MLDETLKQQLNSYMEYLRHPISLTMVDDGSDISQKMVELCKHIQQSSSKISLSFRAPHENERAPKLGISSGDEIPRVWFAGLPLGHEFTSLVLALLHVGGHPPKVKDYELDQARSISTPHKLEVFFSTSCQNCPDVVQAANIIAAHNTHIQVTSIEGGAFEKETEERNIFSVPAIFLDGQLLAQGRMGLSELVEKITGKSSYDPTLDVKKEKLYDVMVVGGGPAGVAAAIYSARKGISTALLAERLGGQVLDTLKIENSIVIPETEGPKLAASMSEQLKNNGVDIIERNTAVGLKQEKDFIEIQLVNGTALKGKRIILAPGARWRQMNVPGEEQYRNKGVAYCPHCDGPLFKGKRVAVIGGGNSGAEAAIDLAGITEHVTLIEFDQKLRADQVLQERLKSLKNITIITSALTKEVIGNGSRVTGLVYEDRNTEVNHHLKLEGIFVQIGLLPNTEWLGEAVNKNNRGEIEVDNRGATSMPGVFAAGDATTHPYKQIVAAMGQGATAALGAFEESMRH